MSKLSISAPSVNDGGAAPGKSKRAAAGATAQADTPAAVAPTVGKWSPDQYRSDLFPARAALRVAEVLRQEAERHGDHTLHAIPVMDHVNHALTHLFAFLAEDVQDGHLEHAACRLMMALDAFERGGP